MTARQRLLAAFDGTPVGEVPFAPLYMGLYRAPHGRRLYVEALTERVPDGGSWSPTDDEQLDFLWEVRCRMFAIFRQEQDWLDASSGTPFPLYSGGTAHRSGERLWWTTPDGQQHEITRDETPAGGVWQPEQPPDSIAAIDRKVPLPVATPAPGSWFQRLTERSMAAWHDRVLTVGSMGTPYWGCYGVFGFAGLMQSVLDAPKLVRYAAERNLARAEGVIKYYQSIGCDCVFIEECLSSADLLSQKQYDEFVLPTTRAVLELIWKHGMRSVFYMCGDVMPRIARVAELPFSAFAVEESKKGFVLDIGEVRRALGRERTLFGNVDVCLVRDASREQIAAEVRRQCETAGADGRFVVSNGSPFTLDTPPARIDLVAGATRGESKR